MTLETVRGTGAAPARRRAYAFGEVGDALAPAALVVYCAFEAGGYFPDTPGIVAAGVLVVLALRVATVRRPFAGFSRGGAAVATALAALIGLTLVSAGWSHAPARALLEADWL